MTQLLQTSRRFQSPSKCGSKLPSRTLSHPGNGTLQLLCNLSSDGLSFPRQLICGRAAESYRNEALTSECNADTTLGREPLALRLYIQQTRSHQVDYYPLHGQELSLWRIGQRTMLCPPTGYQMR